VVELIEYARLARRIPWSEHAVLFRTNQQSRPLELALRQANVRYHLIGGQSFFDRREIRDFLAYLKTFNNPNDDVSLLRIANTPARGLSDVTMERLLAASHERKESVFATMKNPAVAATLPLKAREAVEAFVEFVERTRGALQSRTGFQPVPNRSTSSKHEDRLEVCPTLQTWADRLLDEIGYFNELRRSEKNPEAAESRIRNLKEMMATMDHVAVQSDAGSAAIQGLERLQLFLEEITLDTEREEEEESAGDAVTLITMHSCKGLEFPHVYIVGLEDGLLPHSRSKEEGTLDEERRLFYVAVTRAMQTLTLSHCGGRKRYGQLLPCHPSPFLKELPPELVEHADEKARQPVAKEAGKSFFAAMRESLG
jgi:superfamily I DNA/RNA helicase